MASSGTGSESRGRTTLISVNLDGTPTERSTHPVVSGNGRFVAFDSTSQDLVDTHFHTGLGLPQVFLRDRAAETTILVSQNVDGKAPKRYAEVQSISRTGGFVAFWSDARDLIKGGDPLHNRDVFVRDIHRDRTFLVSANTAGSPANADSNGIDISADGRTAAFDSDATNLVLGGDTYKTDVFVRDLRTSRTTKVSGAADGELGDGFSGGPAISADGSTVVFSSTSSNLVDDDTNSAMDVFRVDLRTGTRTLISRNAAGSPANDASGDPDVSADGRFVTYKSWATDLPGADAYRNEDVFLFDALTGTTVLVSKVAGAGPPANPQVDSQYPRIAADGSVVVFWADDERMVPDGTPKKSVYRYDVATDTVTSAAPRHDGSPAPETYSPTVSDDGSVVTYARKQRIDGLPRWFNVYAHGLSRR